MAVTNVKKDSESVVIIDVPVKSKIIKNGNGKNQLSLYHLFFIALIAFWFGVVFASITLSTRAVQQSTCTPPGCQENQQNGNIFIDKDTYLVQNMSKRTADHNNDDPNKLITRRVSTISSENEQLGEKKIILLHGDKVWTKYDKWHRYDWRKCPAKYSNCRITTDASRMSQSAAVVYNAEDMPLEEHVDLVRKRKVKRVFLSGKTPLRTTFKPADYDNFFDMTVTYKSDSTVRIPYWPNDGLLPEMYRPRPESDIKNLTDDDMLDLKDELKGFYQKSGKDPFMGAVVENCADQQYPNLYMRKLQEEGMIHAYSLNDTDQCKKHMKDTSILPCNGGELSDDCVKHFEIFKYILVPDDDLCIDYTTRKYWAAIFAWQAVPLVYGAGNYQKHLIPNSYIDCVGKEDYVSPSFKKAWYPSQNELEYYKTYHLWRHQNRVEKYHWQCELCAALNTADADTDAKVDMKKFWNKETECGDKIRIHELMRLQLVRTGVIR